MGCPTLRAFRSVGATDVRVGAFLRRGTGERTRRSPLLPSSLPPSFAKPAKLGQPFRDRCRQNQSWASQPFCAHRPSNLSSRARPVHAAHPTCHSERVLCAVPIPLVIPSAFCARGICFFLPPLEISVSHEGKVFSTNKIPLPVCSILWNSFRWVSLIVRHFRLSFRRIKSASAVAAIAFCVLSSVSIPTSFASASAARSCCLANSDLAVVRSLSNCRSWPSCRLLMMLPVTRTPKPAANVRNKRITAAQSNIVFRPSTPIREILADSFTRDGWPTFRDFRKVGTAAFNPLRF